MLIKSNSCVFKLKIDEFKCPRTCPSSSKRFHIMLMLFIGHRASVRKFLDSKALKKFMKKYNTCITES